MIHHYHYTQFDVKQAQLWLCKLGWGTVFQIFFILRLSAFLMLSSFLRLSSFLMLSSFLGSLHFLGVLHFCPWNLFLKKIHHIQRGLKIVQFLSVHFSSSSGSNSLLPTQQLAAYIYQCKKEEK